MESPTAVAAFASVLGPTIKHAERGFEVRAVDEQARSLLSTVQQVAGQLDDARLLRTQKSNQFSDFENRMFDDTFRHCEDAIKHVASLAEHPRADMDVSGGQIKMDPRLVFVLRSSPSITVSLTQLGIASQSLNASIVQLNSRDSRPSSSIGGAFIQPPRQDEWKPSPTYGESQFLSAGRRRNMQRRATAMGLGTVGPPPSQPAQPPPSDRSRAMSASTLYIPPIPSIPELMGDDSFSRRTHRSLPIIRVAGAPLPPSDPIVIESEPIMLSPARSGSGHSQATSSPPRSPPEPRRFNSVSSHSNSEPGARQSSTFTPPQSTGVRTPPNSWAPQFQEPRPPPTNQVSSYLPREPAAMPAPSQYQYPSRHPIVMPAPTQYHYSPNPNLSTSQIIVPPIPAQSHARGASPPTSWSPQKVREYRASAAPLKTDPNQDSQQPSNSLAPSPHAGFGIRNSMGSAPSDPAFNPYTPDFQASSQPTLDVQYSYTPSTTRRGKAGKHRSQSWLNSRALDGNTAQVSDTVPGQQRYVIRNN